MNRPALAAIASLTLLLAIPAQGKRRAAPPDLEKVAAQLLGEALVSGEPWEELIFLCDRIGHRLSGSDALQRAVTWGAEQMRQDGLSVQIEPVQVPRWIRGAESLQMSAPIERPLPMLGLGMSVGTPPEGIEAEVLVVDDFDHLAELGEAVAGRIVLFDVPFTTYGETVAYRVGGPSRAAELGAAAVLVRSVSPESLSTPHTGTLVYDEAAPQIPAAAITLEDAAAIRRLSERGVPVHLRLQMEARLDGEATSANVVGELLGRESPEEIVVVACHLDSWDVGQGAQDDGAGCVAAMEVGRLLAALPVAPRRTVRVVLYTNEENGLGGGRAYAEAHADERHVAALEMDTGAGQPLGFRVDVRSGGDPEANAAEAERIVGLLAEWAPLLDPVGAGAFHPSWSGADIGPLVAQGALGLGLDQDVSGYWPIHHTPADTVDKIDPQILNRNTAALAVMIWLLAESPDLPEVQQLAEQ